MICERRAFSLPYSLKIGAAASSSGRRECPEAKQHSSLELNVNRVGRGARMAVR